MKLLDIFEVSSREKRAQRNQEATYYRFVAVKEVRGKEKKEGIWMGLPFGIVREAMGFITEPWGYENRKEIIEADADWRFYFTYKGYKKFMEHMPLVVKNLKKYAKTTRQKIRIEVEQKRIKDKHIKYKDDFQIVIYKDFDENATFLYITNLNYNNNKGFIDDRETVDKKIRGLIREEKGILKVPPENKALYFNERGLGILKRILKKHGILYSVGNKYIKRKDILWLNRINNVVYQVAIK